MDIKPPWQLGMRGLGSFSVRRHYLILFTSIKQQQSLTNTHLSLSNCVQLDRKWMLYIGWIPLLFVRGSRSNQLPLLCPCLYQRLESKKFQYKLGCLDWSWWCLWSILGLVWCKNRNHASLRRSRAFERIIAELSIGRKRLPKSRRLPWNCTWLIFRKNFLKWKLGEVSISSKKSFCSWILRIFHFYREKGVAMEVRKVIYMEERDVIQEAERSPSSNSLLKSSLVRCPSVFERI